MANIRAVGRAFKKVARFLVGKRTRRVLKTISIFVPVLDVAFSVIYGLVDAAEKGFPEAGSGAEKLAWVLRQVEGALEQVGVKEKRVLGLIELALLVLKGEAIALDT